MIITAKLLVEVHEGRIDIDSVREGAERLLRSELVQGDVVRVDDYDRVYVETGLAPEDHPEHLIEGLEELGYDDRSEWAAYFVDVQVQADEG